MSFDLKYPKFREGDYVKIVLCLDAFSQLPIGKKARIEGEDELPNGDYNYFLDDGTYVHEEEIDFDRPTEVMERLKNANNTA